MASSTSEKIILPQKYYLDYFRYVLDFLRQHYGHILTEEDLAFFRDFGALSEEAQCLFVRFSNRKGPLYRISKLGYEEIPDPHTTADELVAAGFAHKDIPNAYETFNLFTRAELFSILEEHTSGLRPLTKPEIIEHLVDGEEAHELLAAHEPIVQVDRQEEFEFFKLLFFGQYKAQMTEFVIRDVGHVHLEELQEDKFKPWCQSREEAVAYFEISKLKSATRRAMKEWSATLVHEELTDVEWSQFQKYDRASKALDRLVLEIGQQLEREGEPELALSYYRWSQKPPSRERQIRIMDSLDRKEEALALAQELLTTYRNAEEKIFAHDFLSRKAVRINRSMSSKLATAPKVQLPATDQRVEKQVIDHYQSMGYQAIHSENFLWRNLFGLLLWEELFDQELEGFHHPLQRVTSDLYSPSFFEKRRETIEQKMARLDSRRKLIARMKRIADKKWGRANPLVYWYDDLTAHCEAMLARLSPKQVQSVILEQAKNIKDNSTGFPDLFIWNDEEYFFYEIKSPNDHLSAQQLFWIEFMQERGIQADILRVEYITS